MISKKAQGMPIRVIIIAVIGLIVLVVVITLLSGKIGTFRGGTDKILKQNTGVLTATTCEEACNTFGKIYSGLFTVQQCKDAGHQVLGGFTVQNPDNACCCL